ncbi:MAG: ribbon-helix-helix protein, CopG family [Spirulinaceae cyanobacterium]
MASQIPLTCKIPEAWLEAIDHYAESQELSRSDVLKAAIAHLLDLEEPAEWSAHFARLEQQMTKLSKQVTVLHKRLRSVESRPAAQLPPLPPPPAIAPSTAQGAIAPSTGQSLITAAPILQTLASPPSIPPAPSPAAIAAGQVQEAIAPSDTVAPEAMATNAIAIDAIEGELLHQDPAAAPAPDLLAESTPDPLIPPRAPARSQMSAQMSALTRSSPKAPLGSLKLEELCRLNQIDPAVIQQKADSVGLSLAEAIELETGWHYESKTKTYTPPI